MKTAKKRVLAFLMAVLVVMTTVFGNVDYSVKAEETTTYTKVTSVDDITAGGEFVLVAANGENYYALGTTIASKISPVAVTVSSEGKLSGDSIPVWTIAANDKGVSLSNGTECLAYSSSTNFKKGTTADSWSVSSENPGAFRFASVASSTRGIGYQISGNRFGAYVLSNDGYVFDFLVFKVGVTSGTGETPSEPETPVTPTCATVTSSVTPGDVEAGTKVELSCSTEGATILYNTDGTENYNTYTEAITINETTTISARATKGGCNESAVSTFKYIVKEASTPLVTGDKVVFYNDNSGMVMTSVVSGKTLSGVAATVNTEDHSLQVVKRESNASLVEGIAAFDVTLDENGYYTFTNNGKYLTSGATGSSLTLTEEASEYSLWKLEDASVSGKYLVKNVNAVYTKGETVSPQYIEWFKGFTTYSYNASKENIYSFSLFKTAPTIVEAPTNPSIAPAAGEVKKDTVVAITNNTEGATVYYTLDGSEPTTASTEYTDATVIKVTENVTVKAIAYKDGIASDIVTAAYTVATEEEKPAEPEFPVDGTYVIWAPAYHKALSANYGSSYYNPGVDVSENNGELSGYGNTEVWTLTANEDGTYYISYNGQKLSMDTGFSSMPLDKVNDKWTLEKVTVEGYEDCYYVKNIGRFCYAEWYVSKNYWSGYSTINAGSEGMFALKFTKVAKPYEVDESFTGTVASFSGAMIAGDGETKITATSVNGDLFDNNDQLDNNSVFTVVVGGKNVVAYTDANTVKNNHYMGASNFKAGSYLQFETSSYGYSNMDLAFRMRATAAAPANYQVQYSIDGKEFKNFNTGSYYAKYTAYGADGSSSEAEYKGNIADGIAPFKSNVAGQYVEFKFDVPAGATHAQKLYIRIVGGDTRVDGKEDKDVSGTVRIDNVTLTGNPIVDDSITSYVSCQTPLQTAVGQELNLSSATEGAVIKYSVNGGAFETYNTENKPVFTELPANVITYATKDGCSDSIKTVYKFTQQQCEMIKATPNGGAVVVGTGVTLKTATEDATIMYAYVTDSTDDSEELVWNEYEGRIILNELPVTLKVKATKEGYLDSVVSTLSFTQRENEFYNIYFGQLHSHTNFSDGAGSVEEAFQYALNVDNLDFLAVTDHSNSLDNASTSKITENVDTDASQEWTLGHTLAKQYSTDDFTCIYGYEMTWSNGLGHMNTFNTEGFQSRTQTEYSTYSTALQNYYAALNTAPDSISMFNHPGTTFGDFSDFSYYTEANDALITMVEVGNGEGVIGSSGYFPSYEYYTRALDKGWHVSPTNNQDNHKGKWGDANTARSVVLADSNTEENIYDAMRNNRMYATEDNNLSIYYTLDNYIMGTVLDKDQVGDTVSIKIDLSDKDVTDTIGKVEVIVNGGLSIASETVNTNEKVVTFEVPSNYSYYYIKVTEGDGDIAVTSPVWVGEVEACGINQTYTNAALAVSGEALDINIDFYNNEAAELVIDSIEVTVDDNVIHFAGKDELTAKGVAAIAAESTGSYSFNYLYNGIGATTYNVTVNATLNGVAKVYKDVLELTYTTPELVTNVIIDGSHYNDYVMGYYGGNVGAFIDICADKNIKAVIDTDGITRAELESCALLVLSAPAKKSGTANAGDFVPSHYEDDFLAMVAEYVANGGSVIVCGLADYQDSTTVQTATEQNKLLAAIGSTIRLNSDEGYDEVNNGGQNYRLYLENYDVSSKYLAGVVNGQQYSAYSGCTVDLTNATENDVVYAAKALVTGFDTTYSIDCKDENGNSVTGQPVYVEKGKVVEFAHQETKAGGNIFVSGTVFMSDFEVEAEIDNNDSLPYMNYNIICNILSEVEKELEVSTIAEARKGNLGDFFAVEGYVTAGTANEYTTFFDSIYIQDETGGICVFPFAEAGLELGTKVKITGYIDEYQGEKEIQLISYKILDEAPVVYQAKAITTAQAMDYDTFGGQYVKVTGTVTRVEYTSDGKGIAEYWVKDSSGVEAAVFIDGYILSGTTGTNTLASIVKVGAKVSGCGVLYKHPEGDSDVSVPVLRVRDCDDIKLASGTPSKPIDSIITIPSDSSAPEIVESVINQLISILKPIFRPVAKYEETAETVEEVVEESQNLTVEETETTENTIEDEKTPTSAADAEVEAGNNDGSVIPVVVTLTGLLAVLMIAVYLLKTGKIKLKK